MSGKSLLSALLVAACAGCTGTTTEAIAPGPRGALVLDVYPNPVVAKPVGQDVYDFPFEVSLREVGGSEVEIDAIRVEVRLGGLPIFAQTYDETELTRRGFSATVPAGGNVQYRFSPRRTVTTELLFSHASAVVAVSGVDRSGNRAEARATVTVRR